jgi:L-fuconolactonase
MARLADRPRVECKLSGMVTEVGPGWTLERLTPYVRHVLRVFGPERVMWGSDWPVLRLATDYAAWMDTSEALLAHLAPAQRDAVFGSNARRFYGIAP